MAKTIFIPEEKIHLIREYFRVGEETNDYYFVFFSGTLFTFFGDRINDAKSLKTLVELLDDRGMNGTADELLANTENVINPDYVAEFMSSVPRSICGRVQGDNLSIHHNKFFDVLKSPEYKKLLSMLNVRSVMYDTEGGAYPKYVSGGGKSREIFYQRNGVLYHGTRMSSAKEVAMKGLAPSEERSTFLQGGIRHGDTVFLSSDFSTACSYAARWARSTNIRLEDIPVVFEIDMNKIDQNRLVMDYDIYNKYGNGVDDKYEKVIDNTRRRGYISALKVDKTVDVVKDSPSRYNRVGYRGIVRPSAFSKIHVFLDRLQAMSSNPEFSYSSPKEFLESIPKIWQYISDVYDLDESKEVKPPYEEDEFEIGSEGGNNDYFHVNEGYCVSKLKNIDLSEVGEVECETYFDEDEYNEWLTDNELTDSKEARVQYYTDEITYEVTYLDKETFHTMETDYTVMYSDLVELFGDKMAQTILINCMQDGKYTFETFELYSDNTYDLSNPNEVNDIAMKLFPHGEYYKDCRGFILSNGVIVYTPSEHNDICLIPGVDDKFQFVEMGNIRLLPNSIDIGAEPTSEQEDVLRQVIASYADDELYLDIFTDGGEIGVKYTCPDWRFVLGEIDRYYREGIRPQGGGNMYEGKKMISENSFDTWFGNSVLRDDEGNPIKMYHGTDADFSEFSKEKIGSTGSFEGYGFNFTPYESRARSYNSKRVIEAYLRAERPLTTKSNKISPKTLMSIIADLDKGKPYTDTVVAAYETPKYGEKWDASYYRRALPVVAKMLFNYNRENEYGDAGIYADICLCGNSDKEETISAFEKLGYDSVMFYTNDDKLNTVVVFEPNQIKLTSNMTYNNDSNIMSENVESELDQSEVNLSSFKVNDTLAPKLWNGLKLNPKARLRLLDIADDFWATADVTWVKPKGIILTGSICNFNWSKFSDIDLHIVVDFSEVDERKDFVQEYFDGKKNAWNNDHKALKIYGYPVEVYVEDVDAKTNSGGIYDLEENKWVREPKKGEIKKIGLDKYDIKKLVAKYATKIEEICDAAEQTDDEHELGEIGKKANSLLNRIKRMRKYGLERSGEGDSFNIAYKCYRRMGYLDKLFDVKSKLYDRIKSIGLDESKQKKPILEYLDKNYNYPLYSYFKWAQKASDTEKVVDLIFRMPYIVGRYLERERYDCLDDLLSEYENDTDVVYDEAFAEKLANTLNQNKLCDDFMGYAAYVGDYIDLPAWHTMDFNRIVKNEWCIHFCQDADSIAREGFTGGTEEIDQLAYTNAGKQKRREGYDFAYPMYERNIDFNNYGEEAVIFQTSGVECDHYGDNERQVIFWGPDAKNFIPIKYDREYGCWCLYGMKGQVLKSGDPSEILDWVLTNLPQYRKQIMAGKNGYTPKYYDHNQHKQVPYPKYRNEAYDRCSDYLALLKEEVVADSNAEHNVYSKRWKNERELLKRYIRNYGVLMTSKENGKTYKVLYDTELSNKIGVNYCICLQYNQYTGIEGNSIYVRALDKFTQKIFRPEFDTRGYDNETGTSDDILTQ